MAVKQNGLTLKDIKEYIINKLSETSYRYRIFVDAGAYVKTRQKGNLRLGTINGLMQLSEAEVMLLGGNVPAVAQNVTLSFLLPVEDDADENNAYSIVENFREELSAVFGDSQKFEIVSGGVTYVGGVAAAYPVVGELVQRQGIGKSIEYTCYFQFSYLKNAVNASDVKFYLGGDTEPLPVISFAFSRRNTLTANVYSDSGNGEAKAYPENSTFGVDLTLPAFLSDKSVSASIIYDYLAGNTSANTPYDLEIEYAGKSISRKVVFGEVLNEGGGIDNVTEKISFVPYIGAEDETEA